MVPSRILFYNDSPIFGGHEVMLLKIVRELLTQRNYKLAIAYYQSNLHFKNKLLQLQSDYSELELIPLAIKTGHVQGVMTFLQWLDIFKLVQVIKHGFDLICVAQGNIEMSSKMLVASRLARLKLVSYLPNDFMPDKLHLPLAWLRNKFATFLYKLPDEFIVISPSFLAGLAIKSGLLPNKLHLIENVVDMPLCATRLEGLQVEVPKLAIIGAVNRSKNQQFIIDWLCLNPTFAVEVHIIGDGPLLPLLQEQVTKHALTAKVKFWGWRADSTNLMQQMDLLVIPSLVEGVPLVMLEAALVKLPMLATDDFGMADFLPSEMRYRVNDSQEFSAKLKQIFANWQMTQTLIEQNYQKVIQSNSTAGFAESVRLVFAQICALG